MALRLTCVGAHRNVAAFRRAADASGVAAVVASASPEPGAPVAVPDAAAYDLACFLDPVPRLLELVEAQGRAGKSVLLAGPPTEDPAALDRLGVSFARSGAALIIGGALRRRPVCQALATMVAAGRIGAPVYLRYAAEAADTASLLWQGADAVDLASQLLGDPLDVYAVGVERHGGVLIHLALTLRHRGGAVALLCLGVAEGTRGHASLLLLGDTGAAEGYTVGAGLVARDGDAASLAVELPGERVEELAAWLRASVSLLAVADRHRAELARARRLVAALAAVRRSLATGCPEPLGGRAPDPAAER